MCETIRLFSPEHVIHDEDTFPFSVTAQSTCQISSGDYHLSSPVSCEARGTVNCSPADSVSTTECDPTTTEEVSTIVTNSGIAVPKIPAADLEAPLDVTLDGDSQSLVVVILLGSPRE
ncbi:hypothetical protein Dimus_005001 [Dionaea muscipula]